MKTKDDYTVGCSLAFRVAILMLAVTALIVCIPRAVQAVPAEAFGLLAFFLLVPGLLAGGFLYAAVYRLRIRPDGLAAETLFDPIAPTLPLRYEHVSRMERGSNCLHLILYRYGIARPVRILNMNLLEGGPLPILAALSRYIPAEKNFFRSTEPLRRLWRWFSLLENSVLLLGAGLISLVVLEAVGMLNFPQAGRGIVNGSLLTAVLLLLAIDAWILRTMNRED